MARTRGEKQAHVLISLVGLAQKKLAGYGAAIVDGLHQHGGFGQARFFDFKQDLGDAGSVSDCLGIEGRSAGAGETTGQARGGDGGSCFSNAQLHGEIAVSVNRGGVFPLDIEVFDSGQGFGFSAVEDVFQLAFANGFEHEAMLVAELLLFLGIAEAGLSGGVGVRYGPLADAPTAHEHLSLEQFFALARLALHVVDGVAVFYVGVKAKNHKD